MPRAAKAETSNRARPDGRRALLVYLKPEIIKNLKRAGLDEERPAYEIAEEAIQEWLKKRGSKQSR